MARTFAGILGSTAFTVAVLHGWSAGGGLPDVVPRAASCLLGFALLGWVVGHVALRTVEEGVAARLHESLTADKPKVAERK